MTRDDFLRWTAGRLLPSMAEPGRAVTGEGHWRRVLIGPSVSLAVDAFQIPPFTMRVHLVTQVHRVKRRWQAWDGAIRSGRPLAGAGASPGGLTPGYDDARGRVQAYFGFEWPHVGDDYSADALLTEQLASWLRRLAV